MVHQTDDDDVDDDNDSDCNDYCNDDDNNNDNDDDKGDDDNNDDYANHDDDVHGDDDDKDICILLILLLFRETDAGRPLKTNKKQRHAYFIPINNGAGKKSKAYRVILNLEVFDAALMLICLL